MAVLAINAGSSSLKFAVYAQQGAEVGAALVRGTFEGLEPGGTPELKWRVDAQETCSALPAGSESSFARALRSLRELLDRLPAMPAPRVIAHRVVHGGSAYSTSVLVDDEVLAALTQLNALAPLHQPHNLAGIAAFRAAFPQVPQVACFDTAYHATLPVVEASLALPATLTTHGLRRYGFHGLSYQYIMGTLQTHSTQAAGRVLMAHLGNGASLCAARDGRSCATTMSFSTLDGLMMGTRCGALEPGGLLYLLEQGWNHERLQTLLYKQSGLLGVSGVSADMRRLRADGGEAARRAIELFTHRLVREAGALIACLQGVDVLAFSGGIGEHDGGLRAAVCAALSWLGVVIDPALNRAAVGDAVCAIHAPGSRVEVWVVPTDEGRVAATEAARFVECAVPQ